MARKPKTLPPGWKGTGHLPATKAQIVSIHALQRQLGMAEEPYRELIARHGQGVMSSRFLTRKEASKVITEMVTKLGGALPGYHAARQDGATVTTEGNITALATPAQRALIGHLVREVNWYAHGSYEDWLRKNLGLERIVTKEEAARTIEGLKGLKQHGHATKL